MVVAYKFVDVAVVHLKSLATSLVVVVGTLVVVEAVKQQLKITKRNHLFLLNSLTCLFCILGCCGGGGGVL